MRAAFITTASNDVCNVMSAWEYFNEKSAWVTFDHMKRVNDERILAEVKPWEPEVIFFIGSVGPCGPSFDGLRKLRSLAPSIHICFDGVEPDWHPLLAQYKDNECFDLQVTIDGAKTAPVDLVTVAPVNPGFFKAVLVDGEMQPHPAKDIRCGCSGNIGLTGPGHDIPCDPRGYVLYPLMKNDLVTFRQRIVTGGDKTYPDHVDFMRRCKMIINTSFAGSGRYNHVKQRVWESAYAGCALLEDEESPIHHWLPKECYFSYRDAWRAAELIRSLPDDVIAQSANVRETLVRKRYSPENIYGEMVRAAF